MANPFLRLKNALACSAGLVFLACLGSPALAQSDGDVLEEIVVVSTGTYIKRQSDLPSPVSVVGAAELEALGVTDISRALETFTFNQGGIGGFGDGNGLGTTRSINLRGLGPSSSLVLLNGNRTASHNTDADFNDFVDMRTLVPLIAVDRVETLLDGAAALYGSDAVAGVVNVITRASFEGFELTAKAVDIDSSGETDIQMIAGARGERMGGMFALSWTSTDRLMNVDRDFTDIARTSGFGSPGTFTAFAEPVDPIGGGDVIIDNGVHGPINYSQLYRDAAAGGATSLRFADPFCLPDLVDDINGSVVPAGGLFSGTTFPLGTCRMNFQSGNIIFPKSDVWMAYSHFDYEINDHHTLTVEGSYARQSVLMSESGSFPLINGTPIVPASHPSNPFGVDLNFTGRPLGPSQPLRQEPINDSATRTAITLAGDFGWTGDGAFSGWEYTISAGWSEDRSDIVRPDVNIRKLQDALNGFGGPDCDVRFDGPSSTSVAGQGNCYYFSPFGVDIGTNNPATDFNTRAVTSTLEDRELLTLQGVLTGNLPLSLPGGEPGIAIGYQYRDQDRSLIVDEFRASNDQSFAGRASSGSGSRSVDAFFLETYLPVTNNFDIQAAVRHEEYDTGISSTDPKLGIRLQVADALTLRASYGTSFRGPSVGHVVGEDVVSSQDDVIDPLDPTAVGGQGTFIVINRTKNPNLLPEESTNYNIGFSLTPIEDLQIDLDYWSYEFENKIFSESSADILARDPLGPQVIRDPSNPLPGTCNCGAILRIDTAFFNAGKTDTAGIDLSARYRWTWGAADIVARSETTYLTKYDIQTGPNSGVLDGIEYRNGSNPGYPAPEIRSNLFVSTYWGDSHAVEFGARYISSLFSDRFSRCDPSVCTVVGSHVEVDLQYKHTFGEDDRYDFAIGAINLFDNEPGQTSDGFIDGVHSPLLRQVYVKFGLRL